MGVVLALDECGVTGGFLTVAFPLDKVSTVLVSSFLTVFCASYG